VTGTLFDDLSSVADQAVARRGAIPGRASLC
jgi:hypothetical protein